MDRLFCVVGRTVAIPLHEIFSPDIFCCMVDETFHDIFLMVGLVVFLYVFPTFFFVLNMTFSTVSTNMMLSMNTKLCIPFTCTITKSGFT